MQKKEIEALRSWFLDCARTMPWRETPTPYAVWVSEIMLQQTQVAVVIPYFERWMQQFPSIAALAEAPLDTVIKAWEGLGYYSRARNLHAGAQQLMRDFNGELPSDSESLSKIKGIGPYTVGAIRAFAFKQRAAAVDGNVLRVLARYYGIQEEITKGRTQRKIRELAEALLPDERPWEISEALIELGATACQRSAQCLRCPLKRGCVAARDGRQGELPRRAPRAKAIILHRAVPIILSEEHVLLSCGAEGKVMQDLWEFPYIETDALGYTPNLLVDEIRIKYGLSTEVIDQLDEVSHGFTRYKAFLRPVVLRASSRIDSSLGQWIALNELDSLPFSSGHRRICVQLRSRMDSLV